MLIFYGTFGLLATVVFQMLYFLKVNALLQPQDDDDTHAASIFIP